MLGSVRNGELPGRSPRAGAGPRRPERVAQPAGRRRLPQRAREPPGGSAPVLRGAAGRVVGGRAKGPRGPAGSCGV